METQSLTDSQVVHVISKCLNREVTILIFRHGFTDELYVSAQV